MIQPQNDMLPIKSNPVVESATNQIINNVMAQRQPVSSPRFDANAYLDRLYGTAALPMAPDQSYQPSGQEIMKKSLVDAMSDVFAMNLDNRRRNMYNESLTASGIPTAINTVIGHGMQLPVQEDTARWAAENNMATQQNALAGHIMPHNSALPDVASKINEQQQLGVYYSDLGKKARKETENTPTKAELQKQAEEAKRQLAEDKAMEKIFSDPRLTPKAQFEAAQAYKQNKAGATPIFVDTQQPKGGIGPFFKPKPVPAHIEWLPNDAESITQVGKFKVVGSR